MSEPAFRAAVVTVSDRSARGEREDKSGAVLTEALRECGFDVVSQEIVPDERADIERELSRLADQEKVALVSCTSSAVNPAGELTLLRGLPPIGAAKLVPVQEAKWTVSALPRLV